jgi:hypothetical protein
MTPPNTARHLVTHDRPVFFFHVLPGTAPRSSPVCHGRSIVNYHTSPAMTVTWVPWGLRTKKSPKTPLAFSRQYSSNRAVLRAFVRLPPSMLRLAQKHQPISNARSLELSIALGYSPRTFERPSVTLWVMICGSRPPGPSAFCESQLSGRGCEPLCRQPTFR